MRDRDPAGEASAFSDTKTQLGIIHGPSPHWGDWNLTGPASEHKAMMARFLADHPDLNQPWDYGPT